MKYSKKIIRKIVSLIKSDTYTIPEICERVGISEAIYHKWKSDKLEFFEAVKKAEESRTKFFVSEAKKSLLKKVQGYEVDERTTESSMQVDGTPKLDKIKIVRKHFQPDTAAIIFTLCNGDPDNFKNRQLNEITGKGGKDLIPPTYVIGDDKFIEEITKKLEAENEQANEHSGNKT